MRIGLLSDSHIPEAESVLPQKVFEAFQGVDLILHAGDIYDLRVLDELEKVAPVLAAKGDDDYARPNGRLKEKHILELEGHTLWLMHINHRYYKIKPWIKEPPADKGEGIPDIIVSGHEHKVICERAEGILYVNPGSPTLLEYKKGPGTVGILELNAGKIKTHIVHL